MNAAERDISGADTPDVGPMQPERPTSGVSAPTVEPTAPFVLAWPIPARLRPPRDGDPDPRTISGSVRQ